MEVPKQVKETYVYMLSEYPGFVESSFELAGGPNVAQAIDAAKRLLAAYQDVFQIVNDDNATSNVYELAENGVANLTKAALDLYSSGYVPKTYLPTISVIMSQLITTSQFVIPVIAWELRRREVKPEVKSVLTDEITQHPGFADMAKIISENLGHKKDSGPLTKQLKTFSPCIRDCVRCPIANPLLERSGDYTMALQFHCPMFASRLSCLYDPYYTLLSYCGAAPFQIIENIGFNDLEMLQNANLANVSRFRIRTIANAMDMLTPKAESTMNLAFMELNSARLYSGIAQMILASGGVHPPMTWYEPMLIDG